MTEPFRNRKQLPGRIRLPCPIPLDALSDLHKLLDTTRLTELGLDLYVYMAWYWDDETQQLKPYIDDDKVIVGTPGLGEFLYGANTIIPENSDNFTTIRGRRVTKITVNRDNDTKKLIMKSRPLPKPFDVDAWAVINTVAGGA